MCGFTTFLETKNVRLLADINFFFAMGFTNKVPT